jgi:hypothetical protein
MPCEFVISDIQWASADDLRCPIHETTESTCASPTPSGAGWSVRSPLSTPWPPADPRFPKPSVIWRSPMPAPYLESRSRERRCAMQRAVSRTGSAGAWREPFVLQHPEDAGRGDEARHYHIVWLGQAPKTLTRPRNWGRSRSSTSVLEPCVEQLEA